MPLERIDGARGAIRMLTAVPDLGEGSEAPLFLD